MTTQPRPPNSPPAHTPGPVTGTLSAHPATRLHARQTRVIHASEGLVLHVLQGRLWLTQPGDPADRFLCAGDWLELAQDWVVVEADAGPGHATGGPLTAYRLVHLGPQPTRPTVAASKGLGHALRRLLGAGRQPVPRPA